MLPNEGYSEEHFDAFVERWTSMTHLLIQGFKPALPLLAPKLVSLDFNAQSNMLKMLQPHLNDFTQLTSLRYTLSDHYTTCQDDACVLGGLPSLRSLYIRCGGVWDKVWEACERCGVDWVRIQVGQGFNNALTGLRGLQRKGASMQCVG